ncbi:hypothetical protein QCA50_004733 [Cerrena zonata]|uniref:Uncharacterized protein n=1 Tax=Cerrena zonata TaxID=2478898 RepID=A0AAW0GJL5_9APHY
MEVILKMLDSAEFVSNQWHSRHYFKLRRLLLTLSRVSNALPPSLFLRNVVCQDRDAIAGGGYADVYAAYVDGHAVAIKRLRVFCSVVDTEDKYSVRETVIGCTKPATQSAYYYEGYLSRSSYLATASSFVRTSYPFGGRPTNILAPLLFYLAVDGVWKYK